MGTQLDIMNRLSCILVLIFSCAAMANESFSGQGTMACYGMMSITFDKSESADLGEGEGFLDCQPSWGSPSAPPQGIIADGADGSHWVTVDDHGYGDCNGVLWYKTGDLGLGYCDRMTVDDGHQTRLFCGYATCDGDHDRSREKQKGNAGEKRGKKSKPRLPPQRRRTNPRVALLESAPPPLYIFFTSAVFSRVTSPSPPAPFLSSSITKGALLSNWAPCVVRLCSIIAPYGRTK